MRQERVTKRPLRRRAGGGGTPDAVAPPPRSEATKRALQKTDEFLRRLDRIVQ